MWSKARWFWIFILESSASDLALVLKIQGKGKILKAAKDQITDNQ